MFSEEDEENCEGNTIVLDEKICMQKTVYSDANQNANPGKRVTKAQSKKLKRRKSKLRKNNRGINETSSASESLIQNKSNM